MSSSSNPGQFLAIPMQTSAWEYDNAKALRSRSLYRIWRRLSSAQRCIFVLLGVSVALLCFVLMHTTMVPIRELELDTRHLPHPIPAAVEDEFLKSYREKQNSKRKEDASMHARVRPGTRNLGKQNVDVEDKPGEEVDRGFEAQQVPQPLPGGVVSSNQATEVEPHRNIKNSLKRIWAVLRDFPTLDPNLNLAQDLVTVNGDVSQKGIEVPVVSSKLSDEGFKVYQLVDGKNEAESALDDRIKGVLKVSDVHDFARNPNLINYTDRQMAVVKACRHAWSGYKKYAWGYDELKPVQKGYSEWFRLGLTIVDSLDTLWLMNMLEEYREARNWVKSELEFDHPTTANLFEVTIRILGGLLSMYHLANDPMYLEKAHDLGDRLMSAFSSGSKIPYSDVDLKARRGRPPQWTGDSSLSEVATIQLEFKDLSVSVNDIKYQAAADNVMSQVFSECPSHGLCPIYLNADSGQFRPGSTITLGARGDSYFEYLLKQWLQGGKKDDKMRAEYVKAMDSVMLLLTKKSKPSNLVFVGELLNGRNFSPKMDHLVCFLPGTLALGFYHGLDKKYMDFARDLMETCYQMYARMPTGLSPEIVYFNTLDSGKEDIQVHAADAHNLLRPETVESLFIMYRITKDTKYQDYGWKIFEAFEKFTKVPSGGYVSLNNVQNKNDPGPGGTRDKMESFFLAETLKYLYLLFSDVDIVPLDKYVFNTEAHPLPIIH